jgi:hypothetical protein
MTRYCKHQLVVGSQIVFLCIGGTQYDALREPEKRGLSQHSFMPYQSETDLPYSLSAADVHWLSHKPEFEGLLFPSKFYGIAAVGRAIIAITSMQSELARLVSEYRCGLVIEQGDGKTLAFELKRLRHAPELCAAMEATHGPCSMRGSPEHRRSRLGLRPGKQFSRAGDASLPA